MSEELTISALIKESFETARDKGWWENARPPMENLMLIVSEIAEAGEEYRKHAMEPEKFIYTENGKPEGLAVELADALIRIADFCGYWGIPLEEALAIKLEYNKSRPYRHGNKVC